MAKNIIKEIIIILLLILSVILLLSLILYDYVPLNKIVPEKVSYIPPEDLKQELQDTINDDFYEEPQTYKIEAEDLNNYRKIREYVPGKKNPFASIINTEKTNNISNNTNETTNSNSNNKTNENTQKNNNTNENVENINKEQEETNNTENKNTGYIPDKGTK